MTFLAIDIGNTRLKWALYSEPRPGSEPLAHGAVFLETIEQLAEGDWAGLQAPAIWHWSGIAQTTGLVPVHAPA